MPRAKKRREALLDEERGDIIIGNRAGGIKLRNCEIILIPTIPESKIVIYVMIRYNFYFSKSQKTIPNYICTKLLINLITFELIQVAYE